ncbi:MAG TPA: hypothetical protein VFN74_25585, partial [Chloroflexota bacterium]|nr:hypothetical protein [Chloroflexota bacterium]
MPCPRPPRRSGDGPYFLFVGEAGSELGGMQDYYGSYPDPTAARRSIPADVHWAELAAVRHGSLEIVAAGRRTD